MGAISLYVGIACLVTTESLCSLHSKCLVDAIYSIHLVVVVVDAEV